MTARLRFLTLLLSLVGLSATAQDDSAVDLATVAEKYVAAYNEKKIDDILALFTAEAEMIDEIDSLSASGTEEIRAFFESSFSKYPDRRIALEVTSVRQIAANVVVEEGVALFSGELPNEEGDAVAYSATIVKDAEKGWLIASSRELAVETPEVDSDPLEGLHPLEGDWVLQADQMQMDLSFALSPTGSFLTGRALVTTPAEGTMGNDIRIGYDASLGQVRWWTFDDAGGFGQGTWQALEEGWLVRTNGTTADGETTSAIQELTFEDDDTIVWKSTRRFIDGVSLPDAELRLVRRPPAPSFTADFAEPEAESTLEVAPAVEPSSPPKP